MPKEIELSVNKDGEVVVHVKGVKGPECMKIAEFIAKGLGGSINEGKSKKTPEFYEQSTASSGSKVTQRG